MWASASATVGFAPFFVRLALAIVDAPRDIASGDGKRLDHMAAAGALTVADAPVESTTSQPEQAVRAEAEPLVEERGLMAALGSS